MIMSSIMAARRRNFEPEYPAKAAINYSLSGILGTATSADPVEEAAIHYSLTGVLGTATSSDPVEDAALNYSVTGSLV